MRPSRRQFLRAAAGVGVAALGAGGYGALIERFQVTSERVRLTLPRLPEAFQGLKVVQLSDLHFGPYTGETELHRAVEQCNAFGPDLAVITGDFITSAMWGRPVHQHDNADHCARLLSDIRAPLGIFACFGNHDVAVPPREMNRIIAEHKIQPLRNGAAALERDGARLWVAGVDDVLYAQADLDRTLARTPRDEFTLLLAHEPDYADHTKAYPVDLQLSGHSHGGQVTVPFVGGLYYPPLARRYPRGLYRVGNLQLYTNRGVGTILVPMRLGSPPEVTLFTLFSH